MGCSGAGSSDAGSRGGDVNESAFVSGSAKLESKSGKVAPRRNGNKTNIYTSFDNELYDEQHG